MVRGRSVDDLAVDFKRRSAPECKNFVECRRRSRWVTGKLFARACHDVRGNAHVKFRAAEVQQVTLTVATDRDARLDLGQHPAQLAKVHMERRSVRLRWTIAPQAFDKLLDRARP